jgi:hypothetical protein
VREGEASRNAILDLYTEQAMDNLVRARRNMPFVQLAYRGITVQDQDTLSCSLNETYGDTNAVTRGALAAVTTAVHTVSSSLMFGSSKSRAKTLSYSAEPVTDKNDVYELYLAFAKDPGLLMESCNEPKCGYHIRRKCGDIWYWVPTEAGPDFLALVLKTSMMRGPEAMPLPWYERKAKTHVIEKGDEEVVYLELDRSIPAGDGYVAFTLDKKRYQIEMLYFSESADKSIKAVAEGELTNFIQVTMPEDAKFDAKDLDGLQVQIFSTNHPPEIPAPSQEMQRLQDSVNSLDMNLKNLATPRTQ